MINTPHLEGYTDGLSGRGMQDRASDTPVNALEYERGFLRGSLERREMRNRYVNEQVRRITDFMPDAEERN